MVNMHLCGHAITVVAAATLATAHPSNVPAPHKTRTRALHGRPTPRPPGRISLRRTPTVLARLLQPCFLVGQVPPTVKRRRAARVRILETPAQQHDAGNSTRRDTVPARLPCDNAHAREIAVLRIRRLVSNRIATGRAARIRSDPRITRSAHLPVTLNFIARLVRPSALFVAVLRVGLPVRQRRPARGAPRVRLQPFSLTPMALVTCGPTKLGPSRPIRNVVSAPEARTRWLRPSRTRFPSQPRATTRRTIRPTEASVRLLRGDISRTFFTGPRPQYSVIPISRPAPKRREKP